MLKYILVGFAAVVGSVCQPSQSLASEWGCQVLLCLSGDWQGTPSCHPPIYKLITAMKAPGFSWPTCPQANSGAARFDRYEDCPTGWQAVWSSDSDRPAMREEANMCRIKSDKLTLPVTRTSDRFGHDNEARPQRVQIEIDGKFVPAEVSMISNDGPSSQANDSTYYIIARPMRMKPWYIEYDDANGVRQKSWFNLNMP